MIVRIETGLMDVDEIERGLKWLIQSVDRVDKVLGRLLHEAHERTLAGRQSFGEVRITKSFGDAR